MVEPLATPVSSCTLRLVTTPGTDREPNHESNALGVTRRTVATGVAWSVPVIAVGGVLATASASVCKTFTKKYKPNDAIDQIPVGATTVVINVYGASGGASGADSGNDTGNGAAGGAGGQVTLTLAGPITTSALTLVPVYGRGGGKGTLNGAGGSGGNGFTKGGSGAVGADTNKTKSTDGGGGGGGSTKLTITGSQTGTLVAGGGGGGSGGGSTGGGGGGDNTSVGANGGTADPAGPSDSGYGGGQTGNTNQSGNGTDGRDGPKSQLTTGTFGGGGGGGGDKQGGAGGLPTETFETVGGKDAENQYSRAGGGGQSSTSFASGSTFGTGGPTGTKGGAGTDGYVTVSYCK